MAIVTNAGDTDLTHWISAILLGIPLLVVPQVFMVHHVCGGSRINFPQAHRSAIVFTVAGGLIVLALTLGTFGAREVRADVEAIVFLTALGSGWLAASMAVFPWLGLSLRDDAMERRNPAALVALLGAMVAVLLTFMGGNIGEGPAYSENLYSAALGTGGVLCLWLLLELGTDVSAAIAEDRDVASGLRLGGFLIAAGMIFGRAVAGDWHSESSTLHDFVHDGWPAAALWLLALVIQRLLRPTRQRPFPSWRVCGLLPALLYLLLAGVWLVRVGPWEGFAK